MLSKQPTAVCCTAAAAAAMSSPTSTRVESVEVSPQKRHWKRSASASGSSRSPNGHGSSPAQSPRLELHSEEARRLAAWMEQQLISLRTRVDELEQAGVGGAARTQRQAALAKQADRSGAVVDSGTDSLEPASQTQPSQTSGCMQDLVAESQREGYALQESVWDVALLIGHPMVPPVESAFAVFLLLLNIFVQGVLLYGSWLLAQDSTVDVDTRDGFLMWRLSMAHDVEMLDRVNEHTLAQRVCSPQGMAYSMLSQSPTQATAVKNLRQYLRPVPILGDVAIGPLMCACALAIWFASLSCELCGCGRFCQAVWQLPLGPLRLRRSHEDDDRMRVASMGVLRKAGLSLIIGLRLLVVVVLIYTGSLFLIASERVGDLLLNMAALEIIFNIDELLFTACVTSSFSHAVRVLEPLPFKRGKVAPYVMRSTILAVLLALFVPWKLWPDTEMRRGGLSALCDGRQNFVFNKYDDGIIKWAETEEIKADSEFNKLMSSDCEDYPEVWDSLPEEGTVGSAVRTAVRDIICDRRMDFRANFRVPTIDGGTFGLEGWYNAPECADSFECFYGGFEPADPSNGSTVSTCLGQPINSPDIMYRWDMAVSVLREVVGDQSISSCKDLEDVCLSATSAGILVRRWCPTTCGCHDPSYPNYMAVAGNGCPECRSYTESWYDEHRPFAANCTDSTIDELNGHGWRGNWRIMWENFIESVVPILDPTSQELMAMFANSLITGGCEALPMWRDLWLSFDKRDGEPLLDMCTGEGLWKNKPLNMWCPESCNACD